MRHIAHLKSRVLIGFTLILMFAGAAGASPTGSKVDISPSLIDLRQYQSIHYTQNTDNVDGKISRILSHELSTLYHLKLPIQTRVPQDGARRIVVGRNAAIQSGLITASELDAVKWDGFIIKATPDDIAIAGYGPQGTIYGVYAFLKKVGLRFYPWLFNDDLKQYAPLSNAMFPAFSVIEKPFFEHRDGFPLAKGRFGETLRPYALGELKWARSLPALKEGGYIGWDHTAGYLAPIKTYRDTHPQFYAQQRGAPIPVSTPTLQVGLCTCHADLEDITIQNALTWMDRQTNKRFFGITDGDQSRWNCPTCAASDPIPDYYTDRNLQWVNAVARAIRHRHPTNRIFTLAYFGTAKPPLQTGLEPNAMVVYAPWYWLSGTSSAVGLDHPLNITAMEELMAWNRLFPGQIGVYDYPRKWVYGTAERLKLYAKHHIRWVYLNGLKNDLSRWVASQLLWDPTLDVDHLVSEFITASYGPAADTMRTYHASRRDQIQQRAWTSTKAFFQDEAYLVQAQRLLSRAVQQGRTADVPTQTRLLEAAIDGLSDVLQAEKAMHAEASRLRHNFNLYLKWHQRLWEKCIGFSNAILALALPERNPQNAPWHTPAAARWPSSSPRATMG